MRQLRTKLIIITALAVLFGCYEDFEQDYVYSSVYFANQILRRTFVEDEFNTIQVGVVLGGKRVNSVDEWVKFTIDDTTGWNISPYTLLLDSYFSLSSNEEIIIPSGKFMGEITMTIDETFFSDPNSVQDHYVLPFKIYDTSADSILALKDSMLLILTFESRIFGNYYHNGVVIRKDALDGSVFDTIAYHQEEPVTEAVNNWSLSTIASKTLQSNGLGHYAPSNLTGFYISILDDNAITLSEDTALISSGYDWQFEQDGPCSYNAESKTIFLRYKFRDILSGYDCFTTDTLIFRNRILDGVNQWDF